MFYPAQQEEFHGDIEKRCNQSVEALAQYKIFRCSEERSRFGPCSGEMTEEEIREKPGCFINRFTSEVVMYDAPARRADHRRRTA
jgi:hypothetical protein